ncbi:hypothetical protein GCM10009813_07030 [Brevibacterium marinum]
MRIRGEVDLPFRIGDQGAEVRLHLGGEEDGAIDEVLQSCAHDFKTKGVRPISEEARPSTNEVCAATTPGIRLRRCLCQCLVMDCGHGKNRMQLLVGREIHVG